VPNPPRPPTHLAAARSGDRLEVVRVEGDDTLSHRLSDLGFFPGVEVLVEHTSLFGSPKSYRLHGYRLALRKDEAVRVQVKPLTS
jgi:Fe2+ transport system protein FeoA